MRWFWGFIFIQIFIGCRSSQPSELLQMKEVQLADPMVEIDSILFINQSTIQITKPFPGSVIRYTTDNRVVTESSAICPSPFLVTKNNDIKIKAFHPDFQSSESSIYSIRKLAPQIKFKILETGTKAKAPYEGLGFSTLIDGGKGSGHFQATSDWLGFQNEVIELTLVFDSTIYCNQIILSILRDQPSWIFSPKKIEVIKEGKILFSKSYALATEEGKTETQFLNLPLADILKKVILKIYLNKIPSWHPGKGNIPWFFMDEIIVQ